MKPGILSIATLVLTASFLIAAELKIPRLSEEELHAEILKYKIGELSLSENCTLERFKEVCPEETWNSQEYSPTSYCDENTGKCYYKGLTIVVKDEGHLYVYRFDGQDPESTLISAMDRFHSDESMDSIYMGLLSQFGSPRLPKDSNEFVESAREMANAAGIFRSWDAAAEGSEPVRLVFWWIPWDQEIIIGVSYPKKIE